MRTDAIDNHVQSQEYDGREEWRNNQEGPLLDATGSQLPGLFGKVSQVSVTMAWPRD